MKIDRWARATAGWLAAGPHGSCRRRVLHTFRRQLRRNATVFYTVQSHDSAERLRTRGTPWPTDPSRANLGPGVYSWKRREDAILYLRRKMARGEDVVIVRFWVAHCFLRRFKCLDLAQLTDPQAWLSTHGALFTEDEQQPLPHGKHYIQRPTGLRGDGPPAVEHYFQNTVFWFLWFC